MTTRYDELIAELPRGTVYGAVGTIIPSRGTAPYELVFAALTPGSTYAIFVNDQFRGETTSDVQGKAIIRVVLDLGRQDIVLIERGTQARFPAYVDVRTIGTVMAAHADALETIDASLDEIQA